MKISNELDRVAPMVDRINDAIRENPLAAGLIGAGLAWMILGPKGFGTIAGWAKDAATGTVVSAVGTAGGATAEGLRTVGKAATSAARGAASTVTDGVASIVPDIEAPETAQWSNAAAEAASALNVV
jgi:hypothetical protein